MNLGFVLGAGVLIGFLSGLRTFTPIALISWLSIWGWMPLAGSRFSFLTNTAVATVLLILAAGELIGDKLPSIPSRIQAAPLSARAICGAISAGAICVAAGKWWILGLVPGLFGSIVGAFAGYRTRRALASYMADLVPAIGEDLLTIGGTLLLIRTFFGTPV